MRKASWLVVWRIRVELGIQCGVSRLLEFSAISDGHVRTAPVPHRRAEECARSMRGIDDDSGADLISCYTSHQ